MLALLFTFALADDASKATYAKPTMIIEAADVVKRKIAGTVVDVRPKKEYDAGHLPGARWVDVEAWSKAIIAGEEKDRWVERIGKLGIDGKQPIVLIDGARPLGAARVWWILRHWGIEDVGIVNGGWKAIQDAGGIAVTPVPAIRPTNPTLKRDSDRLATKEQLLAEIKSGKIGQLFDARSRAEHCGEKATAKRNGTIPGAKHLEWSDTIDAKTGRFKSAGDLTKLLKEAGIDPTQPTTTYCQSGGRAAVAAFVIELVSGKPARNYYRSWSEWGNDAETPIVKPEGKK